MARAWIIGTLTGSFLFAIVLPGCRSKNPPAELTEVRETSAEMLTRVGPQVERFCGDCHAVPQPESFPHSDWEREVRQGFQFYRESGRSDLEVPAYVDVLLWYQAQAPQKLEFHPAVVTASPLKFQQERVRVADGVSRAAVSSVLWTESLPSSGSVGDAGHQLLFTDMNSGDVRRLSWDDGKLTTVKLGLTRNPAHVEPADLDGDGRTDYLVSDLGSFLPKDHDRGRLMWLSWDEDRSDFRRITLLDGVGRVADARSGDFNNDGKMDVLVAEFGWRASGSIRLLLQKEFRDHVPLFEEIRVDDRHGTIHVPTLDWNGDGKLDFVALITQEHETIELFLNQGDGTFATETIFQMPDPAYGSSGIQLVDMDGDKDLDVLYSNGDSLDSHRLKPYHAISWLENDGTFPFQRHVVTPMPGVYRAVAGDLDNDGDMDIAAGAFTPPELLKDIPQQRLDTLIWLEQMGDGTFERHALPSATGHMALDLGDLDGDGDLDMIVGIFAMGGRHWLAVQWNSSRTEEVSAD